MKCLVPSCRLEAPEDRPRGVSIPLCRAHDKRYRKAYERHWKGRIHLGEEARFASWAATWLQQVDSEMVADLATPPEKPKTYPGYTLPPVVLPEQATRAGQAAISKRDGEQAKLEAQLEGDVAEYRRGRKMELDLELRTKREAEKRKLKEPT